MATKEEPDSLKIYWNHFFKAETGTYEKSTWLELFLAEFLLRLNEGVDPKDLIKFCPVSGVVTLVGCELLCGIHRVTSAVNLHHTAPLAPPLPLAPLTPLVPLAPPPAESSDGIANGHNGWRAAEMAESGRAAPASVFSRAHAQTSGEVLRAYVLRGPAWRCLVLLRTLGVEGLSCCRQLSSVLVWLFGELGAGGAARPGATPPRAAPRLPIHMLFSQRIWAKQKLNQAPKTNSIASSERGSSFGRAKYNGVAKQDSAGLPDGKPKRRCMIDSDQSTESADSNDDLQILNKSMTIKVCRPNDDFEYFDSPVRSSNDYPDDTLYTDPFYTPRKSKPKADDYMNDKHKEIINTEISSFEFALLITDLLQELCKAESSLTGSEGSQISMQCISFSLKNLCSLQFGSLPTQSNYNGEQMSRIKLALTELLIVALNKVLIHSDLCVKLINNGILPMLLRILEDVICKSNTKFDTKEDRLAHAKDSEKPHETEAENLLKFVFGIAYSITAFFHCLLMQCRTVDKLREFTDQFKLYGECLKGGLLKECIELMIRIPEVEEETSVILIKKLIESIGKLVSGMKRVRSEVIHTAACPRSRHKACRQRVAAGMHHHHDVLGEAGTGLPLPSACCVSVLYGTLTSLVTDEKISAQTVLRTMILRVMLKCGVCCCFSPGFLMECIVRLMLTHNSVAPRCLQLLEHTVYGDLGSSILVPRVSDQLPCSICEPCDDNKDLGRKYCHHGVSPIERKSVWSFLIHYNSLLQLDNHNNVLHAAVSHLLKVTPKCRMEMKYELLFSVVYPTFIVSKHRYIIKREESAYFLTVSCLNIFASLLNTVSFAEQFIQKGGLSYVLELVSLPEFSNQCCAILEIAIIVEIYKLMKDNAELSYFREISALASVQMLFKSLTEVTEKCYKIYKLKLSAEKFEELCDLTKEKEILAINAEHVERISMSNNVFTSNDNTIVASVEDHMDAWKNITTFWKSCAELCLYSPMFREHVAREELLMHSYALLKLVLHWLCHRAGAGVAAETRLVVGLMEALLTVQFAVSDATNGRSRAASCGVVRSALRAAARGTATGSTTAAAATATGITTSSAPATCSGAGLSALCDALIGVAVARPSRRLAMPRLAPAKVPPLQCVSSGSSGDGSSGEDAAGPYASEHSEPHPPDDDGYEADVEVGKLEPEARDGRAHKLSDTMTVLSGLAEYESPMEALRGERAERAGELAHPELCLVVVDILSQLIQRVVEEEVSNNGTQENLERVCGGLARALGARLSAGGAPPGLLRRLLAPPAATLLSRTEPHLAELQHSILELIHVVASQSIEPRELAALLQLLAADRPPLAPLLATLQRLVTHADPCTPDFALNFPLQLPSQPCEGPTVPRGAARCTVEGANWGPWLQGFALVLWLQPLPVMTPTEVKTQDRDEVDRAVPTKQSAEEHVGGDASELAGEHEPAAAAHLLSLGQDSLTFELWLNVATGVPTVRLSRGGGGGDGGEGGVGRVLCEGSAACRLRAARWSCLALNVREAVLRRRIHIQVTFYLNGRECDTVSLPLPGILVRKMSATSVVLGQAAGGGARAPAWRLGPLAVYRAPMLTAPAALHLAAHGPDHACQVRCEEPNLSAILTPDVLDMSVDWEQVFEMPAEALRELHDQLLATYSAHAHDHINLYQQLPAPQTVSGFSSRGGGGGGGGGSGVADTLRMQWVSGAYVQRHRGLAPALLLLGGPDILLYLFARVVEAGGSAELQAAALGVALRACRADARLHAALYARDALPLLLPVLAAPACLVSHHMLKEILDVACSSQLLSVSGQMVRLAARPDCALLEPRLLLLLLQAWPHLHTVQVSWEVEGGEVTENGSLWALALEAICALLRDGPRRAFNQQQAARADLLRHLLLACKERFLNSDSGPLSTSASNSLVELVRALVGTPPLLTHLALLCDFLLLMHQASDTFVTHSRANFYFLLTAESPETSDFNFLTFMNKRKNKPYRLKRNIESLSVNETAGDDNRENKPPLPEPSHEARAGGHSGTDNTKEMKGIINAQIRESSRKENGSATQTNGTPKGANGAAGEVGAAGAADALNGYVLVDEDELRHTTVELYTGGIYHQRRVRAGAEPGWTACAGLLLLLRDTLAALPEHLLAQTVCGPVLAENLVVLANHRTACVRAAVVRCVCALQRRAPHTLAATAAGAHYYTHLADQISLYPGSWELATSCAALLTKCDVPLEDQLDDDIWLDVGEEAAQRGAPLLALLPLCLHSVPLAHNVTLLLRRLVRKVSLKALTDVAFVEVVVRAVRDVGHMDEDFEGRELLLEDLYELLNKVAIKALANNHSMQTVVDIHQQLRYVAGEERGRGAATVRRLARGAEGALFAAQLDHLEAHLDHCYATYNKHTNYFANVLGGAESGRARSELCARYSGTLARALAFLLARSPRAALHAEEPLFRRLLDTFLLGATGSGEQRAKWWAGWGAECAAQLQELFWWAASPAAGARALQPALLRALYRAPRAALAHLAPKDPTAMHKLAVYLLIMLQHIHAAGGAGVELAITDWARGWAVATQAGLAERLPCDALPAEAERFLVEDEERWTKNSSGPRQRAAVGKAVFTREGLAARCTESAMAVTRRVVEAQNAERKKFLEHLRRAHAAAAAAAARWRRLIDTHTHERGVWHNPRGWPAAWQLDSTEGPGRVRVRLRRAHLRIPARCFQPHTRYKAEAATQAGPLRSVLGPLLTGARHGGLAARLQPTESVAFMARVHHVTVDRETSGELLLSDRCIHFVPEWCGEEGEGESCAAVSWALGSVARVCPRRWCLQERAAELFLLSGHAHLLAFAAAAERDAFLHALDAAHLPNRTEQESLSDVMNQWRNGTITNWEYLMALNGLAGRSYNDLMQYPVLPFIIADYTSKILDLHDPASFRDLSKPMAVQNKKREQHYINTYNDLKAARREGCSPLLSRQPHHYASLYSNSGGVLHYLVRVPPFTELFLNYQDNNFDMPDRTFHSLATTWRLITNDSPTDVKELIPELFYLPEMFYNNEGLELGVRQCGARVDAVELPRWAADARLFTLAHRQALEAPPVTERLPLWIDLVFGYKQTGQAAVDAINVFPACTYYGFDPSAHEDEVDRTAAQAMVRTYGQAPRQLLRAPHPHAAPDLAPRTQTEVIAGVSGVQWGRYCGSPALGAPAVSARRQLGGAARLVPLPAPHVRAAAACAQHCAPLPYEDGSTGGAGGGLALLSWGHADGALRLRSRRDAAPVPLLHLPPLEQVTQVCTSCAVGAWSWPAFVGLSSGRVLALRPTGTTGARCTVRQLLAHRSPIAALCVCARAALLATADTTGLLLLWDLNRLSYIRTLPNRERLPVTQVAVSETLSDVASVHELRATGPRAADQTAEAAETADPADPAPEDREADIDAYERDAPHKYQSLIRVHTVNGRFVGSVKVSEVVTCICYSNAPEGASVNCIAIGLRFGEVRLYSSWDLQPVRTLPAPTPAPLLSLSYSGDSLVLFAAHADGLLLGWEAQHARVPPPRIVLATALL